MRRPMALLCVAIAVGGSTACGASATSATPAGERLAARIAPTAGDLGPTWKQQSGVIRVPSACPLPRATGCAFRAFALSGDPAAIPGTTAVVQVFPTTADAASMYTVAKSRLTATRTIDHGPVRETITLRTEESRAIDGGHATLLAYRLAMTAPKRVAGTLESILIQEGRGELLLIYKPATTVAFVATARRLALRMQPAR